MTDRRVATWHVLMAVQAARGRPSAPRSDLAIPGMTGRRTRPDRSRLRDTIRGPARSDRLPGSSAPVRSEIAPKRPIRAGVPIPARLLTFQDSTIFRCYRQGGEGHIFTSCLLLWRAASCRSARIVSASAGGEVIPPIEHWIAQPCAGGRLVLVGAARVDPEALGDSRLHRAVHGRMAEPVRSSKALIRRVFSGFPVCIGIILASAAVEYCFLGQGASDTSPPAVRPKGS